VSAAEGQFMQEGALLAIGKRPVTAFPPRGFSAQLIPLQMPCCLLFRQKYQISQDWHFQENARPDFMPKFLSSVFFLCRFSGDVSLSWRLLVFFPDLQFISYF
jgi:hypothetical protein